MMDFSTIISIVGGILALGGGALLFYAQQRLRAAMRMVSEAQEKLKGVKSRIEEERRETAHKLKEEAYRKRKESELEIKRERIELDRVQNKLNERYEVVDKREEQLEDRRQELQQQERNLSRQGDTLRANEAKLKTLYDELILKLSHLSNMTKDQAKQSLLETLQAEVKLTNEKWVQKVEEDVKQTAKERSVRHIATAMQRVAADHVATYSSSTVHLPSEEMKGRVIGKEGRNIKALEIATGMEFIIGDSADIVISGFNPIRREIAYRALGKLVADGRINPTRIEETVAQCERELEELIEEFGKGVVLEFNLQGVHSEIVTLLGKLHFRTSFSQNVLIHCKEVGMFARILAEELGLDGTIAARAGLLHDIGKAVTAEVEGPHAIIGGDIAKRCGEDPVIVNAIAAHHEEVPAESIYAILVIVADTISASRPGARRETLTAYVKRLEKLEEIAATFEGVKKAYALQAGREIRIIVEEDRLDDEGARILARDVASKIEEEMNFPGQIKVNVIREKRCIEYAR